MGEKRILASNSPEDVYKEDYHGHPNYFIVYIFLVLLLGATLIPNLINWVMGEDIISAGNLGPAWWFVVGAIFLFSTWKAVLVIRNFMHVKFEPFLVFGMVGTGLLCLFCLFALVFPDIAMVYEENTKLDVSTKTIYHDNSDGKRKIKEIIVSNKGEDAIFVLSQFKDIIHPKHDESHDKKHDEKAKAKTKK